MFCSEQPVTLSSPQAAHIWADIASQSLKTTWEILAMLDTSIQMNFECDVLILIGYSRTKSNIHEVIFLLIDVWYYDYGYISGILNEFDNLENWSYMPFGAKICITMLRFKKCWWFASCVKFFGWSCFGILSKDGDILYYISKGIVLTFFVIAMVQRL